MVKEETGVECHEGGSSEVNPVRRHDIKETVVRVREESQRMADKGDGVCEKDLEDLLVE